MKRSPAALFLATLVPMLLGCGSDGPQPGDRPVIDVQDQGAEPRAVFAIDVAVGDTETTVMIIDQSINAGQVIDTPAIELTLTNEVTSVESDEIEVRTTYAQARVPDEDDPSAAAVESALADLVGTTATTRFSPAGQVLDAEVDIPAGVTDTVRQTLEQVTDQSTSLAVAFPTDEIGEGATWTVTNALELSGVVVEQEASYELVSLDGDDYEIAVEITQEYVPGEADGFEVTSGSGTTTGTLTGTVGRLAPTVSTSSGTSAVSVESDDQKQRIFTTTDLDVRTTVE